MNFIQVSLESCVVLCHSNTAGASDLGTQGTTFEKHIRKTAQPFEKVCTLKSITGK